MDTKSLIADVKARFSHVAAKVYLKDKYDSKFIVADQGGLWRANLETINFLNSVTDEKVILIDRFDNPVEVNRQELKDKLYAVYTDNMSNWYQEWVELENKR